MKIRTIWGMNVMTTQADCPEAWGVGAEEEGSKFNGGQEPSLVEGLDGGTRYCYLHHLRPHWRETENGFRYQGKGVVIRLGYGTGSALRGLFGKATTT